MGVAGGRRPPAAAGRRRRQHADAFRRVRSRERARSQRALAVHHRARVDLATSSAPALANLLALRGLSFDDIGRSIVSSTVPQLSDQWTDGRALPRARHAASSVPRSRTGMPIRIDNPLEVGADRLVNAVAAYDRSARRA